MKAQQEEFEGNYVTRQSLLYSWYSCPFCSGFVELIRLVNTVSSGVSFCGRCSKCGASGPKEESSDKAMDHFRIKKNTFAGGVGHGLVLPKTIVRPNYSSLEIHIPLPIVEWQAKTKELADSDIPKTLVAIYRSSSMKLENAYAYDFLGIRI